MFLFSLITSFWSILLTVGSLPRIHAGDPKGDDINAILVKMMMVYALIHCSADL